MKDSSKITASELVLSAIFSLRQKNGVTAKEITKYICDKRGLKQSKIRENVRSALERATDNGIFSKKRGLYRIESKSKEDGQISDRKGKRTSSKMKKLEEEVEGVGEPMQCDPIPSVCSLESPKVAPVSQTLTIKKSPDFAESSGMTGSHVEDDMTNGEVEKVYYMPTLSKGPEEEDDDDEDFLDDDDDDDEDFFEDDTFIKRDESAGTPENQSQYQEEVSRKRKMEENSNNFFKVESNGTEVGEDGAEKVCADHSDDENCKGDVCKTDAPGKSKSPKGKRMKNHVKEEKQSKKEKRRKCVGSDESIHEKESKEASKKEVEKKEKIEKSDSGDENVNDGEEVNCECDDCRCDKSDKSEKSDKSDKSDNDEEDNDDSEGNEDNDGNDDNLKDEEGDEDGICDDYYEANGEGFFDENDDGVQGDDCDDGNPDSDGQSQDGTEPKSKKKESKSQGGKIKEDKKQREDKTKEESLKKPQESGQVDKDKGAGDPVSKGKTPVSVPQPVPTSKAPTASYVTPGSAQERNCWKRRNLSEFSCCAKNKNSCSTRKMSNISRRHKSCLGPNATSR